MKTRTKVKILIPKPMRYQLKYQTREGLVKQYDISVPIDENDASFTCYAFGHGVRTFIKERVIDLA